MEPVIMQHDNEHRRLTVQGKRTDDGTPCTLLLVHERTGDCWALYPHGADQWGVRLDKTSAQGMAQAILAEGS